MLRMTDTDQEEFVSCGSSSAAYPAPALAMVQKEEAWPFFLEQMHLSQKNCLHDPGFCRCVALRNRDTIKCKSVELTRRSENQHQTI